MAAMAAMEGIYVGSETVYIVIIYVSAKFDASMKRKNTI